MAGCWPMAGTMATACCRARDRRPAYLLREGVPASLFTFGTRQIRRSGCLFTAQSMLPDRHTIALRKRGQPRLSGALIRLWRCPPSPSRMLVLVVNLVSRVLFRPITASHGESFTPTGINHSANNLSCGLFPRPPPPPPMGPPPRCATSVLAHRACGRRCIRTGSGLIRPVRDHRQPLSSSPIWAVGLIRASSAVFARRHAGQNLETVIRDPVGDKAIRLTGLHLGRSVLRRPRHRDIVDLGDPLGRPPPTSAGSAACADRSHVTIEVENPAAHSAGPAAYAPDRAGCGDPTE